MIKKLLQKLKNFLYKMPVVDEKLSTAIDDKIAQRKVSQEIQVKLHNDVLNNFLVTFFKKTYDTKQDQLLAYNIANKQWKKYCREINSTNKLINLKKDAFEKQAFKVFNKIIEANANNK